ncbi:sugar porter family MFS transporter [Paraflavisolibacter sp. H34]|uniref:sugar porter family MFS transporter n=1 Tax=Huijunlia imazamoxiresistens TaxID=3127457 RepID=UPI003017C8BD
MTSTKSEFSLRYLLFISFIAAMGGYLFGFDFAVISGALPFLKTQFGLDEYWEGFATASLAFGCIIGCLTAGKIAEVKGRRMALLIAAGIFFLSSVAMAVSSQLSFFIAARFLAGIGVGMASVVSPMFIAEIAPAPVRGKMVAVNQLTIVTGILVTNLVNYSLSDNGADAWRWMFGLGTVPSALFLAGVLFLPESPRWLVSRNRTEEARKILLKIGDTHYANGLIRSIEESLANTHKPKYSDLLQKAVLPAVLVGIGLAVFQQFCGINVVFNFTTSIFQTIGFSQEDQLKQTVFIGIVNLLFTLLAMWQVDKLGRKPLMLFGAIGLAVLYILSALFLQQKSAHAAWFLLAAIGTYAMSIAPVTWVLISEIFPNKIRGIGTSIAVVALWMAYALLVFTFPILAQKLGAYTPFYLYAGICLAGYLFIRLKVKETKGKTLEQVEASFVPH